MKYLDIIPNELSNIEIDTTHWMPIEMHRESLELKIIINYDGWEYLPYDIFPVFLDNRNMDMTVVAVEPNQDRTLTLTLRDL